MPMIMKVSKKDLEEIASLLDDTSYVVDEDVMKAYTNKNYDMAVKYMISVANTCKSLADKSNEIIEALQGKINKCE